MSPVPRTTPSNLENDGIHEHSSNYMLEDEVDRIVDVKTVRRYPNCTKNGTTFLQRKGKRPLEIFVAPTTGTKEQVLMCEILEYGCQTCNLRTISNGDSQLSNISDKSLVVSRLN